MTASTKIRVNFKGVASGPEWQGMNASKILKLYEQQDYWIDHAGTKHFLKDMRTEYLWTVLEFIRKSARRHLFHSAWNMVRLIPSSAEHEWAAADEEWARWEAQPWQSPLVRGICAELASRATHEFVFPSIPVFSEAELRSIRNNGFVYTTPQKEVQTEAAEWLLSDTCYCTLDEYLDGHRHHCPQHRPCSDCDPDVEPGDDVLEDHAF